MKALALPAVNLKTAGGLFKSQALPPVSKARPVWSFIFPSFLGGSQCRETREARSCGIQAQGEGAGRKASPNDGQAAPIASENHPLEKVPPPPVALECPQGRLLGLSVHCCGHDAALEALGT